VKKERLPVIFAIGLLVAIAYVFMIEFVPKTSLANFTIYSVFTIGSFIWYSAMTFVSILKLYESDPGYLP
jgi:hypothetical protein